MATATRTRTLGVLCPHCLSEDGTISMDLTAVGDFTCGNCDETFSARSAAVKFAKLAERWNAVSAWIDNAPTV